MAAEQAARDRWETDARRWRGPEQVVSHWRDARDVDPVLLRSRADGAFWDVLDASGMTLLITREYEHLVMALTVSDGRPRITYMPLPHPSGIAVDRSRHAVHIVSTRNPNEIYELRPATGSVSRSDLRAHPSGDRPLIPIRSRFVPGCAYLHDLVLLGGELYATAVGLNAVIRIDAIPELAPVWWPRAIERDGDPDFSRNYLQLNSIAAGPTVQDSYMSASAATISGRRPGHRNFPVDRRGVLFHGDSREPAVFGLTRPHSARWHEGRVWVNNSGYGEIGVVDGDRFSPQQRLPSWTRGLALCGRVAFVGLSRVIARFRNYAPGLDPDRSRCGVSAVDLETGQVLGTLLWPGGNQIFGIEPVPREITSGFPIASARGRRAADLEALFYAYTTTEEVTE